MNNENTPISIVMLGATGAVGAQTLEALLEIDEVNNISLLGRRPVSNISAEYVSQYKIDIFNPNSYADILTDFDVAICTLGVGQPSKMSKEEFIKIDKLAVIDFAKACKKSGIRHFELLSSVGIDSKSFSFYLRTKGELVNELESLQFDRLSIFQPSMILTPKNRYGILQGILLLTWPLLNPILLGSLKKYRGIKVDKLGKALAKNIFQMKKDLPAAQRKAGFEVLTWKEFQEF